MGSMTIQRSYTESSRLVNALDREAELKSYFAAHPACPPKIQQRIRIKNAQKHQNGAFTACYLPFLSFFCFCCFFRSCVCLGFCIPFNSTLLFLLLWMLCFSCFSFGCCCFYCFLLLYGLLRCTCFCSVSCVMHYCGAWGEGQEPFQRSSAFMSRPTAKFSHQRATGAIAR